MSHQVEITEVEYMQVGDAFWYGKELFTIQRILPPQPG